MDEALPSAPRSPPKGPRRDQQCRRPVRARHACRDRRWLGNRRRRSAAARDAVSARHIENRHRAQQLARCRLRPLDQSLSRLRAWLHLLLRPADPCLSRPVARPRFREPHLRQRRRTGAAARRALEAVLQAEADRTRHQHRCLSADRAKARPDAAHPRSARGIPPSGDAAHQIRAHPARHRHPCGDGARPSLQRRGLGDDARSQSRAQDGAARRNARAPAGDDRGAGRAPAFRPR